MGRAVVVVVGDVMIDVVVAVTSPFAHASDTASSIATAPGGAAANQAVWAARGGADVSMLASVGDDPLGDAAIRSLGSCGVDVALVRRAHGPTGVVVALVEPNGQRSMLTDRGANLALDVAAVEAAAPALSAGAHLHLSGYCLFDAPTQGAGLRAIELARSSQASYSVDACSAGPLRALGAARFLEWTAGARFLFANLEEGRALVPGAAPGDVAAQLLARYEEVVLTLGADGVVVATRDGPGASAGAHGAEASDTTGAGDAFSGTYLAARLGGASIGEALDAGARSAALAVTTTGARNWP